LIKPLIMIGLLFALGLALYMRRIDAFVYVSIGLSVIWLLVAPTYQSVGGLGIMNSWWIR